MGSVNFELSITEERGGILLGGKIIDPGKAKNPVRLAIEVRIPNIAPHIPADKDADERKAKKELKRLMKNERLSLKWIDEKSVKPDILEPTDASSPEVSGPGIATLSGEFGKLGGAKLEFAAAPNSALTLSNDPTKPLLQGFTVRWLAEPAKDKESKARLSLQVK